MKKIAVLISFLLIIVGATAQAAAEESSFLGTWLIPWDDGQVVTVQIEDASSIPGTATVTYYLGKGDEKRNGACTQGRIHENFYGSSSTILTMYLWDEIIVLWVSGEGVIGERYSRHSTVRLQRVE